MHKYVASLGTPPPPLCARIIKGTEPAHFTMLSDERGRMLSWVSPPEQVATLLRDSHTPYDWMVAIGYDPQWIEARIADGTEFRLTLFPAAASPSSAADAEPFQVTWDALFDRLPALFGADIAAAVKPHEAALKSRSFEEIDPEAELCSVTLLPTAAKLADPRYMTVDRFRQRIEQQVASPHRSSDADAEKQAAGPSPAVTLHEARAFFYHALGCSRLFRGDGFGVNGGAEWAIPNRKLAEIPQLVAFPFDPQLR